ncbi:MAG: sugar phosphorylase [Cyclobacteriaceae bacterium]
MNKDKLLGKVYPKHEIPFILEGISALIAKYKPLVDQRKKHLSEKDVMLITYGDQVQSQSETPLATLKSFLDARLSDVINSVHVLPFYPYTSDDGFSVIDYKEVNTDLGDWKDIEALSSDYEVMFDAVINHISSQSPWLLGYLDDDPDYKDFFIDLPPNTDLSQVTRPRVSALLTRFEGKGGCERHLWSTFSADQIDINYENPKVLLAVLDVLLYYTSKGARLIRLDAIGFMWKKLGTTCIHLAETHLLIQLMRQVLEESGTDALLVTETNVPHLENISYFGDGHNEAHMVYNFTLPPLLAYSILKQDVSVFVEWAASLTLPSYEVCFFNFLASHDGVGVRPLTGILPEKEVQFLADKAVEHGGRVSYKSNPDGSQSPYELNCVYFNLLSGKDEPLDHRINKMLLAHAILLTMPGVPGIYFHSLMGSQNDQEGVKRSGQNRSINREKLNAEVLSTELDDNSTLRYQIFNRLKSLIQLRIEEPCFDPRASFSIERIGEGAFVIKRSWQGRELIGVFNLSGQGIPLPEDFSDAAKCITGPEETDLNPFGFAWMVSVE